MLSRVVNFGSWWVLQIAWARSRCSRVQPTCFSAIGRSLRAFHKKGRGQQGYADQKREHT